MRYHRSYQSTCSEMVFDPQCLVTDRPAGPLSAHWCRGRTAIGATAPTFPIAVQATCDASDHFCHRANYSVAVFCLTKKKIADDQSSGGFEKVQRIQRRAAGAFPLTKEVNFFRNRKKTRWGLEGRAATPF